MKIEEYLLNQLELDLVAHWNCKIAQMQAWAKDYFMCYSCPAASLFPNALTSSSVLQTEV